MKPHPANLMEQHARFIDALCRDWREAGTVTRVTPRADRIMEISKQLNKGRGAGQQSSEQSK